MVGFKGKPQASPPPALLKPPSACPQGSQWSARDLCGEMTTEHLVGSATWLPVELAQITWFLWLVAAKAVPSSLH